MKLLLLGTSGYHPSQQRHTACILLGEIGVMLDAGSGMFRAGRYLQTDELDIFLTHTHLDHVIGLTYLFDILAVHPLRRVTVHVAAEKLAAIDEHLFCEALFPKKPPYQLQPMAATVPLPQGGRLTHFPLEHPGGVLGFRLQWPGHSLAYVTDTTAAEDAPYAEAIRGVDLLLHECYFPDGQEGWARKTGHSCTTPVARLARAAGVGRLVLVHINPLATAEDPIDLAKVRAAFPAAEIGYDLMELEF